MVSKYIFIRFLLVLSSCFALNGCSNPSTENPTLNIAVANSVHFPMNDIAEAFERKHQIDVNLSANSSGILTTQIKQGAPFDVFVCANMAYPNDLFKKQLTLGEPKVYAHGSLILWTTKMMLDDEELSSLVENKFGKIAIANPETAPYGIAAVEALKKAGVYYQ